ncbi:MAG: hypothetical protein M1834_000011 [Cirrosporium novae-zelandiae]|nr:MAG: hypothetical protein M1834_000011 [Cirrosporium novae-zelandiae]
MASDNKPTKPAKLEDPLNLIRVAVTQVEPAWLDLPKAVEKTCNLIAGAASNNAKLIAFPELWIPGYPAWIWSRLCDFKLSTTYMKNSLVVPSPEMDTIRACAKKHSIAVSLGFSENDGNSLYIAQCTIGPDGALLMHRRKLKPTHMERTVFGDAGGKSLLNVCDIKGVGKVGSLACWEHIQPLLKYHTFLQREEIHVAAWPPVSEHSGGEDLWSMSKEGCRTLSRTYAIESQTFTLHTTSVISQEGIDRMGTVSGALMNKPSGGSSAIFGPDGRQISLDIDEKAEGIIYANLDMDDILKSRSFADSCGHYSRPDLLWLGVDSEEKSHKVRRKQLID